FPGADATDAVVVGVADEDGAVGADGDSMRAVELRPGRRAAVAAAPGLAAAGDGLDPAGVEVEAADDVVLGVDDQDCLPVDRHLLRPVEGGLGRRAAVAGVPLAAGAGDGADDARGRLDRP